MLCISFFFFSFFHESIDGGLKHYVPLPFLSYKQISFGAIEDVRLSWHWDKVIFCKRNLSGLNEFTNHRIVRYILYYYTVYMRGCWSHLLLSNIKNKWKKTSIKNVQIFTWIIIRVQIVVRVLLIFFNYFPYLFQLLHCS